MRTYRERWELLDDLLETRLPGPWPDPHMKERFLTAPASTKYHGAYEGGLFDHSYEVAAALTILTVDNRLTWEHPRSPVIIGLFHDLCKVDCYCKRTEKSAPQEGPYEYRKDQLLRGHGEKSVMLLSTMLKLTQEEVLCIRYHMGAFTDRSEWENYTRAVENCPNVLWTHHADMIASRIKGV